MKVRFSDENWNTLDAKLESIKNQQLNFGFIIVLVVLSVFLYFGVLYFDKKENEFDASSNNSVLKITNSTNNTFDKK
jgi:hypothetical protein